MAFFSEDDVALIRTHRRETVGYILAGTEKSSKIQEEVVRRVTGRRLLGVRDGSMPEKPLPRSWIMAAVLGPDDTTKSIARWAGDLATPDLERIRFYENGDLDGAHAYAAWVDAGLTANVLSFPVRDFKEFIVLFGKHLNQQILRDHRSLAQP
jgi:hypothetical protein